MTDSAAYEASVQDLLKDSALVFREFVTNSGVEWDEAFFRCMNRADGALGTDISRVLKGGLTKGYWGEDVVPEDELIDLMEELFAAVWEDLEKAGRKRPSVVVLRLSNSGDYRHHFAYEEDAVLDIGPAALGTSVSFFRSGEVSAAGP